jgi:hypothetical protein
MYTALRATSLTLAHYLTAGFKADAELGALFDPGLGGNMQVSLNTPEEMHEAGVQGVSLWLYRIIRDDQRLNAPPERITPTRIQPAPLPLRLYYLLTPIVTIDPSSPSASAEQEQVILGKVLQLFHEHPVFRGPDLRDTLMGSRAEIAMRLEAFSMDEISRVWMALKRSYQLSVAYEAAVVNIDRSAQPVVSSPVHTVVPEYATILDRTEG